MLSPLLNDDLRFLGAGEDFAVQKLVTEFAIGGLAVAVSPRASGFDVKGLGPDLSQPFADDPGCYFWTVVGSDMLGHAAHQHDLSQSFDDAEPVDPASDPDCQAFARELIDHRQQ